MSEFDNLHKALSAQSDKIENLRKEIAELHQKLDKAEKIIMQRQQEIVDLKAKHEKELARERERGFNQGIHHERSPRGPQPFDGGGVLVMSSNIVDKLEERNASLGIEVDRLEKENADIQSDLDTVIQHNIELQQENAELKIQCDKFKLLARQRWNDGLLQGQSNAKRCYEDAAKAKEEYLTENERLTNMLLKVEEERDALRAKIESGFRVHASMHEGGFLFVDQCPDNQRFTLNASIVFDKVVSL